MDLKAIKQEIKDLFSLELIDVVSPINTKGSYIHLKSLKELSPLRYELNFALTFVSYSLSGEKDSCEELLALAIKDLKKAKLDKALDFCMEANLLGIDEFVAYELSLKYERKI